MKCLLFITCVGVSYSPQLYAQCTTTVTTFPYQQNFESNNGGWTPGGTLSDWAWGTPTKSTINSAAQGTKCWITGGLGKSGYNDGENSWLMGPCFDFSSLQHPYISFQVFWETERKYDGAGLQYSTDGGASWQNLGSTTDPSNCLNTNWFNNSQIVYLSNSPGWSGSVHPDNGSCLGGNGSGKWVQAQHVLQSLAGLPSVRFRFTFAAGTSCNAFDGFAIDDLFIGEAPANSASFTYDCTSSNSVDFNSTSALCPDTYAWNFGDAGSGANNISAAANPTHTFSAPGTYTVTLTVSGPGNAPSTTTKKIQIISVSANIIRDVSCNGGNNGSASATVTGNTGAVNYSWNSIPPQSGATATNLPAGNYAVSVTATNACPAAASVTITEPTAFKITDATVQPTCSNSNGSISLNVSGSTPPYTYTWQPAVSTSNAAGSLAAGTYIITVKDSKGCTSQLTKILADVNALQANISSQKNISCNGNTDGSATITASGGNGSYTYQWTPSVSNTSTISNVAAGTYTVKVTDNGGCNTTTAVVITEPVKLLTTINTQNTTCGNNNGTASVTATGGTTPYNYAWSNGANTAQVNNLSAGSYNSTVTDANGCIATGNAVINASAAIDASITHTDILCYGNATGTATATVNNAALPYNLQWTGNNSTYTGDNITQLPAGNYNWNITDALGCTAAGTVAITQPTQLSANIIITDAVCNQPNGALQANAGGGVAPYNYYWQQTQQTTAYIDQLLPGSYTITITDRDNCTVQSTGIVNNITHAGVYLGKDTSICPGDNIILAPGSYTSYLWQDGATTPAYTVTKSGNYSVSVTDASGCTSADTISIVQDCGIIQFPSAFTPNGDGLNDYFGPVGNLAAIKNYSLTVYNRWGQMIFQSTDPAKKWNGHIGKNNAGFNTYVFIAVFDYREQTHITRKGTVTIIY